MRERELMPVEVTEILILMQVEGGKRWQEEAALV
eukprot:COSAG06_NODE_2873_length_6147_cov_42.686679_6_plen_34_part_00